MASILPRLLFLSLLIFHCILLVKSDEEDDLLRGLNQYRTSLNLPALTENDAVECLAGEIADRFQNQPCTNDSGPNARPGSEPQISSYPDLLARCRLNATAAGQVLPVCVPRLQPGPVLSSYTTTRYAAYLNDSRFSDVGIASEDDWMIVVLTASASDGSFSPGDDEEDNLLRGINQYRTSRNISPLTEIDSVECFADDVADTFRNRPCTNATGPNAPPGSEPRFSDYPSILAKCRLNPAEDGLILPVCVQPGPVLSSYTMTRYASYLNDTRFSGIGIGSEDDWVVVVLTSNGSFTRATGGPGPSPGPGSGSSNSGSGTSGLVPAVSPLLILVIGFFMFF